MENNQNGMENRESKGLDLSVLWRVFKRRWIFVILAGILLGLCLGAFASYRYVPRYASSVSFLIKVDSNFASQFQSSNVSNTIVHTYEVAFKYNREFCRKLNEKAQTNEIGYTADDVAEMMTCEQILPNTPTLKITFTCPNEPVAAYNLAFALKELANEELGSQFSETLDSVDIFDSPEVAPAPVNGNPFVRMFAVGFVVGAVLLYGIFLLIALTDKVIHGESGMEEFSEYPILGVVPTMTNKRTASRTGKYGTSN